MDNFSFGRQKVAKLLSELDDFNLITRKRRDQGKPNITYGKTVMMNEIEAYSKYRDVIKAKSGKNHNIICPLPSFISALKSLSKGFIDGYCKHSGITNVVRLSILYAVFQLCSVKRKKRNSVLIEGKRLHTFFKPQKNVDNVSQM